MKKFLLAISIFLLLFSLSGCKPKESEEVVIRNMPETLWEEESVTVTGQYNSDEERHIFEWETSNPDILEISTISDGTKVLFSEATLTAKKRGNVTVTLKVYVGGKKTNVVYKSYNLKVMNNMDLTEVEDFGFDFSELTLKMGEEYQLNPTVYPPDSVFKSQKTFKSENTDVATVDLTGKITGISKGTTTVTMTYNGKTLSVDVTVLSVSNSIDVRVDTGDGYVLNPEVIYIEKGEKAKFTAEFNPKNTDTKNFIVFPGDSFFLSIGRNTINALMQGETTFTVQCTEYPILKRTITVIVTDKNADEPHFYDPNSSDPYGMSSERAEEEARLEAERNNASSKPENENTSEDVSESE